jgi:DNA-binding transcriptional LysR family regulator
MMRQSVKRPARVSVSGPESYIESTRQGLGLAQMPRFHIDEDLKAGRLVPVLSETPPPSVQISIVYPRNRQLSTRLRVFIDWAIETFGKENMQY